MSYEIHVKAEVEVWKLKMSKSPSLSSRISKSLQNRVNRVIPEKVHKALTVAIKQMVNGVLYGAKYTVPAMKEYRSMLEMEDAVREKINNYRKTAAAEGGATGAGGFLFSLADFPILLAIKLKMLFDIATMYGFDVRNFKERLFILHIFQLAFSSQEHRRKIFKTVDEWEVVSAQLPSDPASFDWRSFQQEYRDHIDLAKMAQLIPGIGAVVGVIVNYRLVDKLGETAMNAYRLRIFANKDMDNRYA